MASGRELFALGHLAQTFPHKKTVCDIHTNGNVFLGLTLWDVHANGNNWVSMPRPIAHELACVPGGPIPDGFWVVWEGPPPLSPTLTWIWFQMLSRKGV